MSTKKETGEIATPKNPQELTILQKSLKRAFGGGLTGSAAMIIQVTSLMWLRTIMNYQYRYGTSMKEAAQTLYKDGGLTRFYRGYGAALAIGPLSRFGDTAANSFAIEFLKDKKISTVFKTMFGSFLASCNRILLMPIDALKTSLQVDGKQGLTNLKNKIKVNGIFTLWNGTAASMSATFVGHYPWFLTYNVLNAALPKYNDSTIKKLSRNALIGFCSAVISDTSSNSLRVIKTKKQTYHEHITYPQALKNVVETDGYIGLFGRGLKTRILTNGLQGILFTVLWNFFQEKYFKKRDRI